MKCVFTLIDREGTWMEEDTRSRSGTERKQQEESERRKHRKEMFLCPTPNVQCPEILEKGRFRTFKNFLSLLQYLSSPVMMVCKVSTL